MPYKKIKLKSGKYKVVSPNGVKSKATSAAAADAQIRLLNATEHGWEPSKSKKRSKK